MTPQKSISGKAWAELLLLALLWGASFLSIRIALNEIPVVTTVLHRTFWAMLVLWAVVWWMRIPIPGDPRVWFSFLVMGILNNVIPFGLMSWGQLYIETGLTSILNAATAVFGVITAAMLFSDERLTLRRLIGVLLGFAGVVTVIGFRELAQFDLRSAAQWAVLGGAVSYGFASSWGRARLGDLPPQLAAAGMLTGSTAVLLPAALFIDGEINLALMPVTWFAIAYYAIFATALAYLLYYRVLAMAGSGNLMLVTLLIPPVAILLGAFVLGEDLHARAYLGFAILAVGLLILNGTLRWPGSARD